MFTYIVILVITNIFTPAETRSQVGTSIHGFKQKFQKFHEKDILPLQLDKANNLLENWSKMTKIKTVLRKLFLEENITKKMPKKFSFKTNKSMFQRLAWETSTRREKEVNAKQNLKVLAQARILLSTMERTYFTRLS